MTEKNLKIKIVLTFVTMLVLAMLLQSIVVLFLGLRISIQEDIAWTRQYLQRQTTSPPLSLSGGEGQIFSCLNVEIGGQQVSEQSRCRFPKKHQNLNQMARVQKKTVIDLAGAGWNTFWTRSEVAIIAVPLFNKTGQIIGSISAERSLLPIFSRYERDVIIIFCYLLVNALLFGSLGFFRISHLFFRPLDSLVQKAETYRSDEQTFFLVDENESPFRKLSTSLRTLFDRIEKDNRTLRKNVHQLEEVNKELQEKKDLIVRSEKLATAGRLSAGLAHEIGNPLSIIQGYLELLRRDDISTEEKNKFSERAQQELDRIQRLIRQMLDFSRPVNSVSETVSINSLITDVIGFVSLEKAFAACSIRTKFLADDDTIVIDKDALRQVLINCIFNSIDATSAMKETEREVIITTSYEQSGTVEPWLVISIQDNGTGIAEEKLATVFDPFFTTKDVGRGTGLGLFVCHTIIERLNGAISLDNRIPTGVEVKIVLPLQRM